MTRTPEDVQKALDSFEVKTEIVRFEETTRTAQDAADAIGTELGSIIKSLCFSVDGDPVLILTAGDRKVDNRKVAEIYGVGRKRVKIADAETTLSVTGYAPGGVPPVGHETEIAVLIDESLSRFETVYGAGGSDNSIFPIGYSRLVEITGGQVADVVKD